MDPSFVIGWRGITAAYTYLGLYDRASRAAEEAARRRSLGGEDLELKADLGYLRAVSGRRSEALAVMRELTRRYDDAGEPLAVVIAALSAGLGDHDRAFVWLARAEQARDPELGYIKVDPRWDAIRKDPRFTTLLARLNLASQATPEGSK